MATSFRLAGIACLLLLACSIFPTLEAKAQSREIGASALILDDGAGHSLRLAAPVTGWSGMGQFDWVLPLPPTGVTGGFVEQGTAANTSLQWDDAAKYWKAVSGGGTINADVLALPTTTATTGQVTINGDRFIHSYGTSSTFLGALAGNFTLTGQYNTGIGTSSLSANTTGYQNAAVGSLALSLNTVGSNNAALGMNALHANTTGGQNTAVGSSALWANTTASNNTAVGGSALYFNTTGEFNTAIGLQALANNNGSSNAALGYYALLANTTGQQNTAIGTLALPSNTSSNNTALGYLTLYSNTTGGLNTAIGMGSLYTLNTGSHNTAVGVLTDVSSDNLSNVTVLGYQATATQDNQIVLGNSDVTLIQSTGGLLLNGTTGTTPTSGAGTRLMWIPAKGAFRAGDPDGYSWDDGMIGQNSAAFGLMTRATNSYSFASGFNTQASGIGSFASGNQSHAEGDYSTALTSSQATGWVSTAMGNGAQASGDFSVAIGSSQSSGFMSVAIGPSALADGFASIAIGSAVTSNGNQGCFIYGDNSGVTQAYNTVNDQFMVRAAGGTVFYSSGDLSTGVTLAAGGAAWASISDSNKKANRLNISGEDVLNKLSNIWLGSWNYKSQDKSMRHYGPMAQEFFAAFGNDGLGVIGNDTTLATSDVDGVTLIAVKALIERNDALASRVELLEAMIRKMAGSQEATIQKALLVK